MKSRRKLTPEQERDIRKAFFKDHEKPESIYTRYGISEATLRVLIGGPLVKMRRAIEHVYS